MTFGKLVKSIATSNRIKEISECQLGGAQQVQNLKSMNSLGQRLAGLRDSTATMCPSNMC